MPPTNFDPRRYFEDWTMAWQGKDADRLMVDVHDDVGFVAAGMEEPVRGKDAYRTAVQAYFDAFDLDDLEARITMRDGEHVAFLVRVRMRHTGTLELSDGDTLEATDRMVDLNLADFMTLDSEGRITHDELIYDRDSLLQQLGQTAGRRQAEATP